MQILNKLRRRFAAPSFPTPFFLKTMTSSSSVAESHARENFAIPTILGNAYPPELPNDVALNTPASDTRLGLIKVGKNLEITADGTLDALDGPGSGVDSIEAGSGITVDATDPKNPVVAAIPTPIAAEDTLGIIKVGNNLSVRPDGTLDAASGPGGGIATIKAGEGIAVDATDANNPVVSTEIATEATLGAIKVGNNLTVDADGTLNATSGPGGGVDSIVAGSGITVNAADPKNPVVATLPTPIATNTTLGSVKIGANLAITADGTLSANAPGPGPTPGAGKVVVLTGDNYSYTVKATDLELTLCFVEVTANPTIFIDGNVASSVGQLIHCIFTGPYNPQVVPLNRVRLDTGGLGGARAGGRSVGYNKTSADDYKNQTSSMEADLICVADKFWVFRSSLLQMGAPFIEYAGVVRSKFTPGALEIISNAEGEDFARIFQINYIATPFDKTLPTVTANRKPKFGGDPYILGGLVEGKKYRITTEWEFMNIPGDPPPYLKAFSINFVDVVAPSSLPPAPTNVQIKGFRGSKTLFTMDPQGYAPIWSTIQAEVITEGNKCITKNGDSTFVSCGSSSIDNSPYFKDCYSFNVDQFPSILPSGDKAQNYNNCKVRIKLVTPNGLVGVQSDQFIVNFKDGFVPPVINIKSIDKFTKVVLFDWIAPEPNYDTDQCQFLFQIFQGDTLKSTQTLRWSDTDCAFSGDQNTDYSASLTDDTYGVVGVPGPKVRFRIPAPF